MTAIDITKRYTTRSGLTIELIPHKGRGMRCVLGYIDESPQVHRWYDDGKYSARPGEDDLDLIPAKEKKTGWINIYRACLDDDGVMATGTAIFTRKEFADQASNSKRLACVQIEWEE